MTYDSPKLHPMNVPSPLDPEIAAHILEHPPAGPLNLRQREQVRASRRAATAAITLRRTPRSTEC